MADDLGSLHYIENTGTSTAPAFVQRTGSANPFDGMNFGGYVAPAFEDLDGDGTLRPRPLIGSANHKFLPLAGDLDLVLGNDLPMVNYFANGYCTSSCGGRGVCDGSANLLPTCDCLTGFTGDHHCLPLSWC